MLIGVLHSADPAVENWGQQFIESGLAARGWVKDRDFRIELRAGYSDPVKLDQMAHALVKLGPDVIFTGSNAGVLPLRRYTTTIPIVAAFLHDPIGMGLANSLAHPQGNVTGVSSQPGIGLNAKRMQLLQECVPSARRLAALWAVADSSRIYGQEMRDAAQVIGVALDIVEVRAQADFPAAFDRISALRPDGLVLAGVGTITQQMRPICAFALAHKLPAIHGIRQFTQAGLLMGYGYDTEENYRRAVTLIEKILTGVKPGELPIERPSRLELSINRETARAIGVTVPAALLQRAEVVIG